MTTIQTIEWRTARTMAHLWINGRYTGISLPLKSWLAAEPDVIAALNLPPLPRKGG